jgi:hypothetical protein
MVGRGTKFAVTALVVLMAGAGTLAACGDDEDTNSTTTVKTATETGPRGASAVETTPGGAVVPAAPSCAQGQIYSQGSGACVDERQGGDPCPTGEVPEADQPVCVPKD